MQRFLISLFLCFYLSSQIVFPQSLKKIGPPIAEPSQKVVQEIIQTKNILLALQNQNNGTWSEALKSWEKIQTPSITKEQFIFQNRVFLNQIETKTDTILSEKSVLFLAQYLIWYKKWRKSEQVLNKINSSEISNQGSLLIARLNLYLGKYKLAKDALNRTIPASSQERLEVDILNIWILFLTGQQKIALRNISELKKKYLYINDSLLVPHGSLSSHEMAQYPWLRSLVIFPQNEEFLENIFWRYWTKKDLTNLKTLINTQISLLKGGKDYEVLSKLLGGEVKSMKQFNTNNMRGYLTPKYIEGRIEIARTNQNWIAFKSLVDQYIKLYPELKDGKLFLREYDLFQNPPYTRY